jgi:nitroreductase
MNPETSTDEHDLLGQLVERRYSCRGFLSRPLPRTTIESMLAAAQRAASWCNAQPWRVHVISGDPLDQLRAALVQRANSGASPEPELEWPREYRGVYLERRRACGWALYQAVGVTKGDREGSLRQANENFNLFGAPHLAILTSDSALGTHGVLDCGGWLANFMLAATAHGVGTVAQAALASWPDILRAALPIGDDRVVVCGVSFGYADSNHPANRFRTSRATLDDTVHWLG